MTVLKHELRQGRTALFTWTAAIGSLLMLCVFIFPETRGDVDEMGRLFASMGRFTAAFGMDRLDLGTLTGYYCVECGTILGLGGAFFASLAGISALAKEEGGRTAEFLLTHPIARGRVAAEKLAAVLIQLAAMDLAVLALALASMRWIGQPIPWREVLLLHGANGLLQAELAGICFGISAFLRRSSAGIGVGLAAVLYLMNLVSNMTDRARFLKLITPFGYCEGADIVADGRLNTGPVVLGMALACAAVAAACLRYGRKDIL